MLVPAIRWFLIIAPVIAGILVLILGTAGSVSTTFGIVLIGIGPTVWLWNIFVRMSFIEPDHEDQPPARESPAPDPPRKQQGVEPSAHQPLHRKQPTRHPQRKLTRLPRRRS